nr:light yellow cell peptide [Lymnaea stagnalis, Peptide Partial, 12 aa] [Lymnaea stagnalis]prf//1914229A neuropeptide [Lymnaea stagnalis]
DTPDKSILLNRL